MVSRKVSLTFRLVRLLVSDDFGLHERGISAKSSCENLICHVIAEIAAKNPKIIWVPFLQCLVLPNLKSGKSKRIISNLSYSD